MRALLDLSCSVGCNVYMLSLCCIDSVRCATPSPTEKHEDAWTKATMALFTKEEKPAFGAVLSAC
jgi:hypothetical protein